MQIDMYKEVSFQTAGLYELKAFCHTGPNCKNIFCFHPSPPFNHKKNLNFAHIHRPYFRNYLKKNNRVFFFSNMFSTFELNATYIFFVKQALCLRRIHR